MRQRDIDNDRREYLREHYSREAATDDGLICKKNL